MVNQNPIAKMLNQINKKSKKKWNVQDIKQLAKGFSSMDIHDDKKLEEIIKKVGNAAGVKMSKGNVKNVKKKVYSKLSKK